MKIELYSVKDTKVGFSVPFSCVSDDVALRQFIATVRSSQPNFCNTFPEDKMLYHVGSFDDQSGVITPCEPNFLAHAVTFVQAPVAAPEGGQKNE